MTRSAVGVRTRDDGGSLTRAVLGAVDELSYYDDSPREPNNVHLEVLLPGHLDEEAFRAAVAVTLGALPRARARLAPGGPWRPRMEWEFPPAPDIDPVVLTTWRDQEELARERASFLASAPPLDTSPPLRLLLASGPGADCVILNAHHAALDGISCLQVLYRVAGNYDGPFEHAGVSYEANAESWAGPETGAWAGPAAANRRVPPGFAARIVPQHANGEHGRGEPGYGFHLLRWPCVPSVRRHPGAPAATVNDVLIAALIVAISQWNDSHGARVRPIRVTMPLSGRGAGPGKRGGPGGSSARTDTEDTMLGNLSRLAAVTARPPRPGSEAGLLIADVARQTRHAKENPGPQIDPLSRALAAPWCPVAVKRRLLRAALHTVGRLICDTSLVSNLGNPDPPRFGPAAPEQMWFSTSAHMPRGLSVGVITTGGRLHLCFRYRRALFDEVAAAGFARLYARALSALTSAGPER
ncbi:MAG: hypothetical protein ACM3ML_37840 [Micromonosporaceae bacterium]